MVTKNVTENLPRSEAVSFGQVLKVVDTLGGGITQHGHCWNTTGTPTISDSKTELGIRGLGAFTSSLTDLALGRLYYVRAYATNSAGTSYGSQVTFTASKAGYIWWEGQHLKVVNESTVEITMEDMNNARIMAFLKLGYK